MLEYLAFRFLSLIAPLLPPGVAYWLCDRIGDVTYWVLPRRRRTVRRNLRVVFGGDRADMEQRCRRVFREGTKSYYDTFRVPAMSSADLNRMVTVDGWDHLDRALSRGKGALVFSAHYGSPSLVGQILAVKGYKVTTAVEPVKPDALLELMLRVRSSRGIRMIPVGPTTVREMTDALKRNEIAGILVDRDLQKNGAPVAFFGVETTIPTGPVMLAMRTGAALVPAFTYRDSDNSFKGSILPPLELDRTGALKQDLLRNTQKVAAILEQAIKGDPEQWVVFEPIWPEAPAESSDRGVS